MKATAANAALVAALVGARAVGEATAADGIDSSAEDFWRGRVRICHGGAQPSDPFTTPADAPHGGLAHHAAASSVLTPSDGVTAAGHTDHAAPHLQARRGIAPDDVDVDFDGGPRHHPPGHGGGGATDQPDTPTPPPAGGGSGGGHPGHGGGGTPPPSGGQPAPPPGGGHTHSPGGGVAHPTDPAKQAEHDALLKLVPATAATHVAVNDGSWFDPNTWANGQVPGADAKVLIPQGVTVLYDQESPVSLFTVRVDGELDFATDVDTFMEVDTLVVTPTGHLTIGTDANPVDADVSAVIQIADNGPIDVRWDPMLLSRGVISHGAIEVHGAEKESFLKVKTDPMKGDTTLTLDGPPDGWEVGDKIVVAGTHLVQAKSGGINSPIIDNTEDEELVITAINGNVVTVDRPLQYDHDAPRADLKTYVANYSRNVEFATENAANVPVHQRGHVMLMHSDDISVKYAEFNELGRTDKSRRSFDVSDLQSVAPDSNVKGRYSLHIHRAGVDDPANPAIVEGNAVWGSPGWGFVHHDSNAILSDNAAYDVFGAAFVAETGNETGRWVHNIAIKSLGIDHVTKDKPDIWAFDLGRTGTGFWFQGRLVEAVDNVAASVPSGAGFTYFHRGPKADLIPLDPNSTSQPDIFRYEDSGETDTPPISLFKNNESFATQTGLEIIKTSPWQGHQVRSVIDSFLAWEVQTGAHLQYTGHYTFLDFDAVGSQTSSKRGYSNAGLHFSNNVIDVVVNGANIEGFTTGIDQVKRAPGRFLSHIDQQDAWEYVYIDVDIAGAKNDFSNRTPGDRHLVGSQLTNGLSYASSFADTHVGLSLAGWKTDSLGTVGTQSSWDPLTISSKELRGAIEQNGYWTTVDGRRVTLIEEYISDRATGDLIKVGLFVEIPSYHSLKAGGFTRIDPINHGVLNENSRAPVAGDDAALVKQGDGVVIDVLANDYDPDGDAIKLDGLFSQHGHVVDNGDGTVTYFADTNYQGDDVFYYWVHDDNGDITKGQVTVTVEV